MTFKELQAKFLIEKNPEKIIEILIEFAKDPTTSVADLQKVNNIREQIQYRKKV